MSSAILAYFRNYRQRQHVRPWALAAPILILLLALPLLSPLRHPTLTPDEAATLTAIQTTVEHQTTLPLSADAHIDRPAYVFLLAGPYWLMYHSGLTFDHNPVLVSYLLTIIGVTFPVAMCAGLIYRMGRMFELRRPWRMGLALACVLASGLFSYATVLNAQAPAAFAILWSCACLVHVAVVGRSTQSGPWLALAGLLAATAAVIEPAATAFLLLFPLVILAMRWPWSLRLAGVLVYALGTLPPIALDTVLLPPDPIHHVQSVLHDSRDLLVNGPPAASNDPALTLDDPDDAPRSPVMTAVGDLTSTLFGSHGLLSHFPVLALAIFGIAAVMHRHWPTPTKMLAGVTAGASLLILLATSAGLDPRAGDAFASRWFVVFSPALFFWCGAWLRRSHRPGSWAIVGTLLGFSVIVSLLGATDPLPVGGYQQEYTPLAALRTLVHPAGAVDPAKVVTTIDPEPHPDN
jgi:hypothetical protein